jgi:chromosome segregation ATPase
MNKDLDVLWGQLKTQRDELRVKAHLAKAELKDEWEELEEKWQHVEKKLDKLQHEAKDTAADMRASATIVLEEISDAYDRIRHRLNH